ncbi:MAG: kelch repeat-containing protein [Flavobacteriales bacterium]
MRNTHILIALALMLGWAGTSHANIWTQKANFSGTPRRGAFGFSISGKGYVGTGNNASTFYNDLWEYDPGTNVWTQKANVPGNPRWLGTGFALGTKGYAGLGENQFANALNDFYEYDPVGNTWTPKAAFGPGIRRSAASFTIGNKGYVACGQNGVYVGTLQNDLWEYDPAGNTWTPRAAFPGGPRLNPIAFGLGGYGYLGMGYDGTTSTNDLWKYDPGTNAWTAQASCPGVGRTQAIGMAIGTNGYVGAGYSNSNTFLSDFWEFDPNDFITPWRQRDYVGGQARALAATFTIGNKGYVTCGLSDFGFYGGHWEFDGLDIRCGLSSAAFLCSASATSGLFGNYAAYNGSFNPGNVFTALLSDANGIFNSPVVLGSVASNASTGSIPLVFPAGLATGSGYRIMVTGSNPAVVGNVSGPLTYIQVFSPGDPCDDGDPCTIGDQLGPNCFCQGGASSADSDGDGFCDAIDGCPFNGLLQGPIGWFPDTDGDGFGDAGALGVLACDPPFQNYVTNQGDLCDLDPAKQSPGTCGCGNLEPGSPCDDGNPCTTPDIINFACQCLGGLPLDTDGDGLLDCNDLCPLLPFLQNGDPCDDNDPCTANDVVTNCTCAGTPSGIPTPTASNAGPFCVGDPLVLNGTAGGGFIFSWTGPSGPVSANLNANLGPATPSMAGVYTFQSSNGTCTGSATTTVVVNTPPSLSFSTTPESCPGQNDGAIDLTVNGGVGTPTYNWSSNIPCAFDPQCPLPLLCLPGPFTCGANNSVQDLSGLPAAQYTVTVNMGGCSVSQTITVGTASPDTDGDAVVDCLDNCPLLAGQIGDPCNDNDPNTINDVITGACQCAGTPCTPPVITGTSNTGPTCSGDGGYIYSSALGTAPLNYTWTGPATIVSPNQSNSQVLNVLAGNTYTVTVTNACGMATATTAPVVNTPPTLSPAITPESCPGANDGAINLTLIGGGGPVTYVWSSPQACLFNGQCPPNLPTCSGGFCTANTQNISALPAGTYSVQVLAGGCFVTGTYTVGTASPDTDGDAVVDCLDNCPAVPGQIGSPCNDNDPNTINDVINGSCVCAGTPSCAGTQVTLTLNTDGNAVQTTWDIVVTNTNNIVCSGGGHPNNSTISVNCCLPNGCYDLRVFDSAGDGINPGGFVLRDANNERIIDDVNNGPNFTTLSKVTDASNNPVGFCVPIGTDAITPASCDLTGLTLNSVVSAVVNAGVSAQYGIGNQADDGYQFWVFNPNGGYSRRIFFSHASPGTGWPNAAPVAERCSYFRLSAMNSTPVIPSNVLLNIRVRSRINGVNSEFGPACRLTIGTANTCALTQLTTTANPLISCGATGVNRITGVLWSNAVTGANRYQFQFVNANTNVLLRNLASPTRNLNMATWGNAVPLPTCFQPYNVRVRVSFNNGATYCAWGPWCTVTFTCPPQAGRGMEAITGTGEITLGVYPNPSDGSALQLAIGGLDPEAGTMDLDVLDALGRTVIAEQRPVRATQGILLLNWPARPASGTYLVRARQGDRQAQQRVMVQ